MSGKVDAMDERRARDLARAYGSIEGRTPSGKRRDEEYSGRHQDDMKYAIALQLMATVPDAAEALALKRQPLASEGEATAVVVAVDERALYVVECTALSPPSAPRSPIPTIQTERISLDPSAGRVSVATTFGSSFSGKPLYKNRWTFEIGGASLAFESERIADSGGDDEERFARALAKALGYSLPGSCDPDALAA